MTTQQAEELAQAVHDLSQHAKPTRASIISHANHIYCGVKHKTNRTLDKCASATVTRAERYPHNRKALADYILQPWEEEYTGPDLIARGFRYLIGENTLGQGVALAWSQSRKSKQGQVLTHRILNAVLDEAKMAGFTLPIHIYASASTAPITAELYRFHQLYRMLIHDGAPAPS